MVNENRFKFYTWNDQDTIKKIKNSLEHNRPIITDTDTVPGFLAMLTLEGYNLLQQIKNGRENKPYIVLISDIQKLTHFITPTSLTPALNNIIKNCWPGPLTIIFKAQASLPVFLKSQQETIAIRCPKHKELQSLLTCFPGLFSTSANKSDQPAPASCLELDQELVNQCQYIISNKISNKKLDELTPLYNTCASTILDFSNMNKNGDIKVVREGAYPIKEIEKYYGQSITK